MAQRMLVILYLFMNFALYGSQEFRCIEEVTEGACLSIVNETSWPASVFWNSQNKEYNTIVDAHSYDILGTIVNIASLEIWTYGQVWGSLFPKHSISLERIREDSVDRDVQVIIEKHAWSCGWSFRTHFCEKPEKRTRFLPLNPWSAFPGVNRAHYMNRPVMAHHILNVDPSHISQQTAINCYKRLIALWNPEKFSCDAKEITQSICAILRQAHLDLQRELIEDSQHSEKTVYQTSDVPPL